MDREALAKQGDDALLVSVPPFVCLSVYALLLDNYHVIGQTIQTGEHIQTNGQTG